MLVAIMELGVSFWLLSLIGFIALVALVETKSSIGAMFTVVAYLLTLNWFASKGWTTVDVFSFVKDNVLWAALGVLSYFVIGTLWSVLKWWSYVKGERRKYDEMVEKYEKKIYNRPMKEWDDTQLASFKQDIRNRYSPSERVELHPQVREHKEDIFLWISFWVFSAFWTIIDDPIRRICKGIYNLIGKQLQKISDNAWQGVDAGEKK